MSTDSATGDAFSIVIATDDQAGLDLLNTANIWATVGSRRISNGDTHVGVKQCVTTLSHEGYTYDVSYYVKGTIPSPAGGGTNPFPEACAQIAQTSNQTNSVLWIK